MRQTEIVVKASDSTKLLVKHYRPSQGTSSRTLLIVHGMSEHSGRYDHIAPNVVDRGWNLIIPDLRGHGRSGGAPIHIKRFRQYVGDLQTIRRKFRLRPRNTALLGHSMGGLVALRAVQLWPGRFACLVLMSPLLGVKVEIPALTVTTGRVLSYFAPRTRFRTRFDPTNSTRNQAAVEARLNDPEIYRTVTAGWFFAMKASMNAAWTESDKVRLPLLLMQAGEDHVVDAAASAEWFESVGSLDKTYCCFKNHFHELFNEPDWAKTVSTVLGWLNPRMGEIRPSRRTLPIRQDLRPFVTDRSTGSGPLAAG